MKKRYKDCWLPKNTVESAKQLSVVASQTEFRSKGILAACTDVARNVKLSAIERIESSSQTKR